MELKMKQRERYNNTDFLYVIHNHHFQYRTSLRNKLKKNPVEGRCNKASKLTDCGVQN